MAPIGARGAIDHILERNMPKTWLLAGVMLASIAGVAHAQDVAKKLTLDRVFGEPSLAGPSLRGLKLSHDGTLVTLLTARDRKSGVEGKSVTVRGDLGGCGTIKKKKVQESVEDIIKIY